MAYYKEAKEDPYIEDANNNIGALGFFNNIENTGEMEIKGPFKIGDPFTTLFSNKLLDPLIT